MNTGIYETFNAQTPKSRDFSNLRPISRIRRTCNLAGRVARTFIYTRHRVPQ